MTRARVLLVDDDPSLLRVTQFQLEEEGYEVAAADRGETALAIFRDSPPDLVITDLKMPGMDGLELLSEIRRRDPEAMVIVITAHGSVGTAIRAMKLGAHDYLCKPFEKDELMLTARRAAEFRHMRSENARLSGELLERYRFENIVGGSEAMEKVFAFIRRVSRVDSTVLLEGESGTGKELIARAIHYAGPRRKNPFVAVNCAAVPEHLMESEFFGHVKGAFTGALHARTGKFEQAEGGTLFLDEIADMRLDLQTKLLRVLQEREIDKVGAAEPIPVDVRVIAATNKNLRRAVDEGSFREDLYYRIGVLPLRVPSLRERLDDIPLLVRRFLAEMDAAALLVETGLLDALQRHSWPGNIRELRNTVEQALVLRKHEDRLTREDLPGYLVTEPLRTGPATFDIPPEGIVLDDVEKHLIARALEITGGNQNRAAKLLGITRQTLIYRMDKHQLRKDRP